MWKPGSGGLRTPLLKGLNQVLFDQQLRGPRRQLTDTLAVVVLDIDRGEVKLGFSKARSVPLLTSTLTGKQEGSGVRKNGSAFYWFPTNGDCMLVVRSSQGDSFCIDDAVEINVLGIGPDGAKLNAAAPRPRAVAMT